VTFSLLIYSERPGGFLGAFSFRLGLPSVWSRLLPTYSARSTRRKGDTPHFAVAAAPWAVAGPIFTECVGEPAGPLLFGQEVSKLATPIPFARFHELSFGTDSALIVFQVERV